MIAENSVRINIIADPLLMIIIYQTLFITANILVANVFAYSNFHLKIRTKNRSRKKLWSHQDDDSIFVQFEKKSVDVITTSSSDSSQESTRKNIIPDYLILSIVPIIWGTYSPLISFLYDDHGTTTLAPPPLLFNALSFIIAYAALTVAGTFTTSRKSDQLNESSHISTTVWKAGIELGLWLFIGSSVQLYGLQSTSPIKAGVLVQTTTILVPLVDSLLNAKRISQSTILSCLIATAGILILSVKETTSLETLLSFDIGDTYIIIAALAYSMHVVRLSALVGDNNPIELSRIKSLTELILCIIGILISFWLGYGNAYSSFLSSAQQANNLGSLLPLAGVIIWNGAIATALTTWAQSFGQKTVSATNANLLYSTQPIWSAIFSFVFLQEVIDSRTLVGSGILMAAIWNALLAGKSTITTVDVQSEDPDVE